jgi:hypothetical protein
MTSIRSLSATGRALARDLSIQVGGDRDARIRSGTLFRCRSQAYMVHTMNAHRLRDRFLSCMAFSSAYVAILPAAS